jgi:hypothetical protein
MTSSLLLNEKAALVSRAGLGIGRCVARLVCGDATREPVLEVLLFFIN